MTPDFKTLELTVTEHVAQVNLDRPDRANAMDANLWRELQECFEWLDAEPAVRAVVLAGNGKHFCAGIDLELFASLFDEAGEPARQAESLRRTILALQDNLSSLEKCRKPVLAAIHGSCLGAGLDLVCCADMRYATGDARFSIREVDFGMAADVGTLQRMPRIVPEGLVRELAFTGRDMDADEARRTGFVNEVYEDRDSLLREVCQIARTIAGKSPLAVRGIKEMLLYTRDHPVRDGLNYVATWNAGLLSRQDLQASVSGWMKNEPVVYDD